MNKFSKGDRVVFNEPWLRYNGSTVPAGTEATVRSVASAKGHETVLLDQFPTAEFDWMNAPARVLDLVVTDGWTPTIENCDNYMDERTGKYEFRKVRYDAAIEWMSANGLKDGMTVYDIGSGMGEFGFCLMHDHGFNIRYIPIDGGVDGTNLETWVPPRDAHFSVALELIEHLHDWERLVMHLQLASTMGVVMSTPNPRTTDVIGMDPTHVKEIWPDELAACGFDVRERTFYGGVFSDGEPDSLFATWKRK